MCATRLVTMLHMILVGGVRRDERKEWKCRKSCLLIPAPPSPLAFLAASGINLRTFLTTSPATSLDCVLIATAASSFVLRPSVLATTIDDTNTETPLSKQCSSSR